MIELSAILKREMIKRIHVEINNAMNDKHVIEDDWIPFDADWDINIWTEEGLTKAAAYEVTENGITKTKEWVDLYQARLHWPTRLANGVRISRDDQGHLCVWAECVDLNDNLHWVNVTWLDLSIHELLGEEIP